MKKLLLSLGLGIISFAGLSQVQLKINGACAEAGGYADVAWADQLFYEGDPNATQSWFGTPNMLIPANSVTADLVLVEGVDADTVTHGNCIMNKACNGVANITNTVALAGNIAVISRGACEFGSKALAAQDAGAVACIIVNQVEGLISMGAGTDGPNVTIPVFFVKASTGDVICNAINNGCGAGAFLGNFPLNNNLSCAQGDVYRPGRGIDNGFVRGTSNPVTLTPGALITNKGINAQTGITVTCEVYELGNPSPLYSETSAAFDLNGVGFDGNGIPTDSNVWVPFTNIPAFTTSETDKTFEFKYIINAPNVDDDSSDDTIQSYFTISQNKFSHAQIDPATGKTVGNSGRGPVTEGTGALNDHLMLCSHFTSPNGSQVGAIGHWFQAYTYDPVDATSLIGKRIECAAYEWTNNQGNYDISDPNFSGSLSNNDLTKLTSGVYFYEQDLQDSVIYQAYNTQLHLEDNKHYLFCNRIEVNDNLTALKGFNFKLDTKTDYTATNGDYTGVLSSTNGAATTVLNIDTNFYAGGYGAGNTSNHIVHMVDSTILGVNDIENNRALVAYPNPAVDMITVPFGNATGTATINIYDVAGKLVSTQVVNLTGNVNVNVSELENGMYNFNIVYDDGSSQDLKVVVTK